MIDTQQTIVAIASPLTPAGRGVVRLSGQDTMTIASRMCAGLAESADAHHARRYETCINLGESIGRLPVAILLWPTPRSYTGQPSAEFHLIGSLPLLQAVVDLAIKTGARAAGPGEFTLRAFLAGRLDLIQAEAVLGVIDAQQRGSLDHSLRQLAGNLSRPLETMRGELLNLLADVEAGLDFVDEDIEFVSDADLANRLKTIHDTLEKTQDTFRVRNDQRQATRVTLCGKPNVGKSRLLNALVGREAALVAELAGTTRDQVIAETDISGLQVQFIDTAGFENAQAQTTADELISRLAQQKTRDAINEADIRIWCFDATEVNHDEDTIISLAAGKRTSSQDIHVQTKSDLVPDLVATPESNLLPDPISKLEPIATSSVTGQGIDQLRERIAALMQNRDTGQIGSVIGTAARCKDAMQRASTALATATHLVHDGDGHEFVAMEIRTAVQCLGEVTGAVYTEDILDRVFGRFCIGK